MKQPNMHYVPDIFKPTEHLYCDLRSIVKRSPVNMYIKYHAQRTTLMEIESSDPISETIELQNLIFLNILITL